MKVPAQCRRRHAATLDTGAEAATFTVLPDRPRANRSGAIFVGVTTVC